MRVPSSGQPTLTSLPGHSVILTRPGQLLHMGWPTFDGPGWLCQDNRIARRRDDGYAAAMAKISYRRHRFPPVIIQHAVWLYLRFTLSYRDVEELLAERGLDISYETVRCWVLKFGPIIALRLRRHRSRSSTRWHLDEMVIRIAGDRMYLWRAVDHEGEVFDRHCHGNGPGEIGGSGRILACPCSATGAIASPP